MAKYSTGSGSGGGSGDACELCGKETGRLQEANVAGATLLVCGDCAPHGETKKKERRRTGQDQEQRDDRPSRKKRAARNTARMMDAGKADSKHWEEEGTHYERDRLPYLVSDYDDRVTAAREDAGLTIEDVAAELEVDADDLRAVERGDATRAGVGGSVIRKLEDRFGVALADE